MFNAIRHNEEIFKSSFIESSWDKIMDFVIVVFIYLVLSPTISTLTQTTTSMQKGICRSKNGELKCCSGYYLLNGTTCRVCLPGTYRFSDTDEGCTECNAGFYGRLCAYVCKCTKGYYCSPVDGTCTSGKQTAVVHSTGPTRTNSAMTIVPVLLVLFLMLSVFTVCWIWLYKRYVLQDGESGRTRQLEDTTTISCIIYYINKLRVKLAPASVVFDPDNHDEYGFDDGHYCSIRESAMIRPLNQGHASLYLKDGPEDDKYNHLNPKIERKITDVYLNNGNIYTKIQNVQSGKQTTVTLPNYDRMELNKDQH